MGHLAFIEGSLRHVVRGEPHPLAHWAPLFASGTQPMTDAAAYLPFDEVVAAYRDLRARILQLPDEIGEAGLRRRRDDLLLNWQITATGPLRRLPPLPSRRFHPGHGPVRRHRLFYAALQFMF